MGYYEIAVITLFKQMFSIVDFCLYFQDSGKKTNWRKRWAVISDFCIYFYKGLIVFDSTKSFPIILPA